MVLEAMVDASRGCEPIAQGALVKLLRRGASDANFLVVFPGMTIEPYTFYMDADGARRFDILQSKGGD